MSNLLIVAALAFHFTAPEGWTDFSHGVPPEQLAKLPPEVAEDAQHPGHAEYAVDLRHVDENAVATYSASVLQGAQDVDFVRANAIATALADMAAKKGEHLELVDAVPQIIKGIKAGRIRYTRPFRSDRMDVFVLPLNGQTAMLTFFAPMEKYDEYEAVFQKTAEGTIAEEQSFTPLLRVIAFGSVIVGAALGAFLIRRLRKKKAPTTQPATDSARTPEPPAAT